MSCPNRSAPQCAQCEIDHVIEEGRAPRCARRWAGTVAGAALLLQLTLFGITPAIAAPGGLVADVIVKEPYPENISPSVGFDGAYLYHTGYGGAVLPPVNVPPPRAAPPAARPGDNPSTAAAPRSMTLPHDPR